MFPLYNHFPYLAFLVKYNSIHNLQYFGGKKKLNIKYSNSLDFEFSLLLPDLHL